MRCVAEVSSFNLMYNLCMYYEKQKCYDKTELTFQPTLVHFLFSIGLAHFHCTTFYRTCTLPMYSLFLEFLKKHKHLLSQGVIDPNVSTRTCCHIPMLVQELVVTRCDFQRILLVIPFGTKCVARLGACAVKKGRGGGGVL